MSQVSIFESRSKARRHFPCDEVEQCDRCKRWSASQSDNADGQIVDDDPEKEVRNHGAYLYDDIGYDRICLSCQVG